jgi:hypothetical protein
MIVFMVVRVPNARSRCPAQFWVTDAAAADGGKQNDERVLATGMNGPRHNAGSAVSVFTDCAQPAARQTCLPAPGHALFGFRNPVLWRGRRSLQFSAVANFLHGDVRHAKAVA